MNIAPVLDFRPAVGFHDPNMLFADGGVIGPNPSRKGGTWACRLVQGETVVWEHSGMLFPEADFPEITNNHTELQAVIRGLFYLPSDWRGTVWSDSKITLGRVFLNWATNNIPRWMVNELENQKARLIHWNQIHYGLCDGHPTLDQLAAGVGKRGHPVNVHQKWCDRTCVHLSTEYFHRQHEAIELKFQHEG